MTVTSARCSLACKPTCQIRHLPRLAQIVPMVQLIPMLRTTEAHRGQNATLHGISCLPCSPASSFHVRVTGSAASTARGRYRHSANLGWCLQPNQTAHPHPQHAQGVAPGSREPVNGCCCCCCYKPMCTATHSSHCVLCERCTHRDLARHHSLSMPMFDASMAPKYAPRQQPRRRHMTAGATTPRPPNKTAKGKKTTHHSMDCGAQVGHKWGTGRGGRGHEHSAQGCGTL